MGQLRKQSTELNRLKKMKEENDKMVRKMTEEVVGLKAMRVKHIRQMKADAEEFRKWKQASAKEVLFSSCVYVDIFVVLLTFWVFSGEWGFGYGKFGKKSITDVDSLCLTYKCVLGNMS